jgi:hypothetical protein
MTDSVNIGAICKKVWLSEKETENYTGLGYDVLKRLREKGTEKGKLPYCRIDGSIRYKRTEVDKFFENHTVKI